ncbi:MAG: serine/threonine protein kinase [Lachnospiraceae bacterium]|nr:serine/threonine protein kinase [Lachnospiraceae bacterium]
MIDGRYLLESEIKTSGNGSIYLARDLKLDKIWLIKSVRELYQNEWEVFKKLSCPFFPRITDIITYGGHTLFVMDYIEGETLTQYLKNGSRSMDELKTIFIQIAEGLKALHNMTPAILYLDCKPDNIIITPEGKAVIIDFGSTYFCDEDGQRISGTPAFAAPEQKTASTVDVRSDIYALGMTMYYAVTGTTVEYRDRTGHLRPESVVHNANRWICRLISRCCEPDPNMRYQRMDEIIEDLRRVRNTHWAYHRKELLYHLKLVFESLIAIIAVQGYISYGDTDDIRYVLLSSALVLILLLLSREDKPQKIICVKDVTKTMGRMVFVLLIPLIGYSLFQSGNINANKSVIEQTITCMNYRSTNIHTDNAFRMPFDPCSTQYLHLHTVDLREDITSNEQYTVCNERGECMLYRGQNIIKDGKDYILSVPKTSLTEGNEPSYIVITD